MKAMVLKKTGPIAAGSLELVDLPVPEAREKEVLIEVSACGVCHTELDQIEGRLECGKYPVVPGHQVVGKVIKTGAAVQRFNIGDRLGVTWLYRSCGKCDHCASGNENLCAQAKWTGKDANGGYAEFMVVDEDFAHKISDEISDLEAAPLLCAGVIGYRALRLAQITDGQSIGLFGFGASAHIIIQLIKHRYPGSDVFVFTRSAKHQALAKKLGAAWAGVANETPPGQIKRAIDFTPIGSTITRALELLAPGGRLVINAIRKETAVGPLDYAKHLWMEKEIKSVANVTMADGREFLQVAGQLGIKAQVEEFSLAEANEVLIKLKQGRIHGAAVLRPKK
jgi:propanol-preferring alcohol dehydrogenase